MNHSLPADSRGGLLFALAAYGLWGLMPFYFHAVGGVRPIELVSHRIIWSVLFLAGLLTVLGRWSAVWACLRAPRTRWLLVGSTLLIAANWFVFIYGVTSGQMVQNSLGYFINPLLSILLGVFFFGERLGKAQWLALGLAAAGLVYLVGALGEVPWIAFFLAGSFALYGLIRKIAPVDPLTGLMVETLFLLPAAVGLLVWWLKQDQAAFGASGRQLDALLLASGVVTAVPLLCFGAASRRLRLSTLGFMQYLAPSLQLLLAVLVFGESFRPAQQVSFALIWSALVLLSLHSVLKSRTGARSVRPLPAQPIRSAPLCPECVGCH
jgi:chloramphenicol-sensitive protein RarD